MEFTEAVFKRKRSGSLKDKKTMKGYIPSYLDGNEKCVVCGDKATGYHYRCITCEGCKGFFRRTVQKNLQESYRCKSDGVCEINKISRNQCQLCRYQKCLTVGMATNLVLDEEKRVAKRRLIEHNREMRRRKEINHVIQQFAWERAVLQDEERDLIGSILHAFNQSKGVLDDKSPTLPPGDRFSVALTNAITNVVDFAKRIPLFVKNISTEDQVSMLKAICMDVIVVRAAVNLDTIYSKQLSIFAGVKVTRTELKETPLNRLADPLFDLAEQMTSLDLDDVDAAVLQALVIFRAESPEIQETEKVKSSLSALVRAYSNNLLVRKPQTPDLLQQLLEKLKEVRSISNEFAETVMHIEAEEMPRMEFLFTPHPNISATHSSRSPTAENCDHYHDKENRSDHDSPSTGVQPTRNESMMSLGVFRHPIDGLIASPVTPDFFRRTSAPWKVPINFSNVSNFDRAVAAWRSGLPRLTSQEGLVTSRTPAVPACNKTFVLPSAIHPAYFSQYLVPPAALPFTPRQTLGMTYADATNTNKSGE